MTHSSSSVWARVWVKLNVQDAEDFLSHKQTQPGTLSSHVFIRTKFLTKLLYPLQLFKGKFYHCLGVDIRNITNRSDCMAANYKWVHHKYNFDNLGQVNVECSKLPRTWLRFPLMTMFIFSPKEKTATHIRGILKILTAVRVPVWLVFIYCNCHLVR